MCVFSCIQVRLPGCRCDAVRAASCSPRYHTIEFTLSITVILGLYFTFVIPFHRPLRSQYLLHGTHCIGKRQEMLQLVTSPALRLYSMSDFRGTVACIVGECLPLPVHSCDENFACFQYQTRKKSEFGQCIPIDIGMLTCWMSVPQRVGRQQKEPGMFRTERSFV